MITKTLAEQIIKQKLFFKQNSKNFFCFTIFYKCLDEVFEICHIHNIFEQKYEINIL